MSESGDLDKTVQSRPGSPVSPEVTDESKDTSARLLQEIQTLEEKISRNPSNSNLRKIQENALKLAYSQAYSAFRVLTLGRPFRHHPVLLPVSPNLTHQPKSHSLSPSNASQSSKAKTSRKRLIS